MLTAESVWKKHDLKQGKKFITDSSGSSSGIAQEALSSMKEMQQEQNKFMREQMEWMKSLATAGPTKKGMAKRTDQEEEEDEDKAVTPVRKTAAVAKPLGHAKLDAEAAQLPGSAARSATICITEALRSC